MNEVVQAPKGRNMILKGVLLIAALLFSMCGFCQSDTLFLPPYAILVIDNDSHQLLDCSYNDLETKIIIANPTKPEYTAFKIVQTDTIITQTTLEKYFISKCTSYHHFQNIYIERSANTIIIANNNIDTLTNFTCAPFGRPFSFACVYVNEFCFIEIDHDLMNLNYKSQRQLRDEIFAFSKKIIPLAPKEMDNIMGYPLTKDRMEFIINKYTPLILSKMQDTSYTSKAKGYYNNYLARKQDINFTLSCYTSLRNKAAKMEFSLKEYLAYTLQYEITSEINELRKYDQFFRPITYTKTIDSLFRNNYFPNQQCYGGAIDTINSTLAYYRTFVATNDTTFEEKFILIQYKNKQIQLTPLEIPTEISRVIFIAKNTVFGPDYNLKKYIEFNLVFTLNKIELTPDSQCLVILNYATHLRYPSYVCYLESLNKWIKPSSIIYDDSNIFLYNLLDHSENLNFYRFKYFVNASFVDTLEINRLKKLSIEKNNSPEHWPNLLFYHQVPSQSELDLFLHKNLKVQFQAYVFGNFKDINDDGISEIFCYAISDGKILDALGYSLEENKLKKMRRKSLLKLLESEHDFQEIKAFSQTGNRGDSYIEIYGRY